MLIAIIDLLDVSVPAEELSMSAISSFHSTRKSSSSNALSWSSAIEHGNGRHQPTSVLLYLVPIFFICAQSGWLSMAASATTQTITKRRIGPIQSPVVSAAISKRNSEIKAIHALRKAGLTGFLALVLLLDW